VLEDTNDIVAGFASPWAFDEFDSTAAALRDEVGVNVSAEGSVVGESGVSRPVAAVVAAVHEADDGPRESEARIIASANKCISVGEVRERETVLDAE
jgi:hypothetical protein